MTNSAVVLRAADRRAQRWKNGGGTTAEVWVYPSGSALDEFEWRISIADVTAAGAFSSFPGVHRILTVLEGELALSFGDESTRCVLTTHSDPYGFAGDLPCHGEPLTDTVRDLNVMVLRARWSATVERLYPRPGLDEVHHDAGPAVVVALTPMRVDVPGHAWTLEPLDAILLQPGVAASLIMQRAQDRVLYARFTRLESAVKTQS